MKHIVHLVFFFLSANVFAQPNISYSESFPEPEAGWKKLIVLKNGYTAYLDIGNDFTEVRIYDKDHKRTRMSKIQHSAWTDRKMSASALTGVYEINGKIVMFVDQQMRHNIPVLKKVTLDPETARMVNSTDLMTLDRGRELHPYSMTADETTNDYVIWYPTDNDHSAYRVVVFDSTHHTRLDTTLQLEGIPAIRIKSVTFLNGNLNMFFNGTEPKAEQSVKRLYMAVLKQGSNQLVFHNMEIDVLDAAAEDNFRFNKELGMYEAVINGIARKETKPKMLGSVREVTNHFYAELILIDPEKYTITGRTEIGNKDIKDLAKKMHLKGFWGSFRSHAVNEDGSTDLIFEERSTAYVYSVAVTRGGNIGIDHLGPDGKLEETYLICKAQIAGGGGIRDQRKIDEYFSYSYFTVGDSIYVVFNNIPENFDTPLDAEPQAITSVTETNATLYKLYNGKVERSYLFGRPADKKSSKFSMNNSSVFDTTSSTFITLMVSNHRGDKKAHIAWVQF